MSRQVSSMQISSLESKVHEKTRLLSLNDDSKIYCLIILPARFYMTLYRAYRARTEHTPCSSRAEQPLHVRPLHRARAEKEVCSALFGEEDEPSRAERSFKMFGSARLGSGSPLCIREYD